MIFRFAHRFGPALRAIILFRKFLGTRRRDAIQVALLLHFDEILLSVTANLNNCLGFDVCLDFLPVTLVQIESLNKLLMLFWSPAFAGLAHGIGLPGLLLDFF